MRPYLHDALPVPGDSRRVFLIARATATGPALSAMVCMSPRRPSGATERSAHIGFDTPSPAASLIRGVPDQAVMKIMGWSHSAMAARFQHVTAHVQHDIANRVGELIWRWS